MMSSLVSLVSQCIGAERFGKLEYFLRPDVRGAFGPLNGSPFRQRVFSALVASRRLSAIVETGTFRGTSCEFFAATGLPVYSVEAMPRYFGFAKARLRTHTNVHLKLGDSRSFLRSLATDPSVPKSTVFFYLDAHWSHDLPLRDEVAIVFDHWQDPVIMIDDFEVKTDPDYGFDDYGNGNALTLDYLDAVRDRGFQSFFPSASASQESQPKRGWVVLSREGPSAALLRTLSEVKEYPAS